MNCVLKTIYDGHEDSEVRKLQVAFKIYDSVDLIDFILRMTFRSQAFYVLFLAVFFHSPQKKV